MNWSHFAGKSARLTLLTLVALVFEGCGGKLTQAPTATNDTVSSYPVETSVSGTPEASQYQSTDEYVDALGQTLTTSSGTNPGQTTSVLSGLIKATRTILGYLVQVATDSSRVKSAAGSIVVHWGHGNIPDAAKTLGSSLLYSGKGFGSYYTHARGKEVECIQAKGDGDYWKGEYADALFPLITGNAVYLPTVIPEFKVVSCSVLFVPTVATAVIKGSDSCPTGWTGLYKGYLLGGHYTHAGGSSNSLCMDPEGFDGSMAYYTGSYYSVVYGTQLSGVDSQLSASYYVDTFVKCAVCAKN